MLFLLRLCRQRHSISNIYTLSRDSPELRCRDYCLTDVSGPAPAEPEIYRSTAGKFDKTASKKAKMTGDQFREIQKALRMQDKALGLSRIRAVKSRPQLTAPFKPPPEGNAAHLRSAGAPRQILHTRREQ
jgi:hypothetical protein